MKKIGISSCFFHADPKRAIFKGKTLLYLEQSLAHWVMREGALVYLIPSTETQSQIGLADLTQELDGLILQGGSDVAPESYGEKALRPEWAGDFIRDRYERELISHFMKRDKPILGICRGAQILNVALGGTLYQDIETQIPGALVHRNWEVYDENFHEITFDPKSWTASLYDGKSARRVNTIHHQAIKRLGDGVVAEARSIEDQVIEAIRVPSSRFVYGIQWHPEFQDRDNSSLLDARPILREFISAC